MISIIIPTYNNSIRLIQTIRNVLSQNNVIMELIIIDDSSTDNTKKQILLIQDERIKYYYNSKNIGTTNSRIVGIKKAQGEYIAFIDDDDDWMDNKLYKQKIILDAKPYDFVTCNYTINDEINKNRYNKNINHYCEKFTVNILQAPGPFLQCCLFKKNFLLNNLDGFDKKAEPSEDWDFFITISKLKPQIAHISEFLFQWNLSISSQSSNLQNEAAALDYIINKHAFYILAETSARNLSFQFRKLGHMYFKLRNKNKSVFYYYKAKKIYPYSIKNWIFILFNYLPISCQGFLIKRMI